MACRVLRDHGCSVTQALRNFVGVRGLCIIVLSTKSCRIISQLERDGNVVIIERIIIASDVETARP